MMRSTAAIATLSLAFAACDRGIDNSCNSNTDSACAGPGVVSGSGGSGGKDGGGNGGGTKTEPDTSFFAWKWQPAWDTGASIGTLSTAADSGVPSIVGGKARRVVFYRQDSIVRIVATSDGDLQSTFNRETVYDLKITSSKPLVFSWDSKPDQKLADSSTTGTIAQSTSVEYYALAKMPVVYGALQAHVVSHPGASLKIWVRVRSGYFESVTEDSLPRFDIAATRATLFSGKNLNPIPSNPFILKIP